jgi:hypothetical protein
MKIEAEVKNADFAFDSPAYYKVEHEEIDHVSPTLIPMQVRLSRRDYRSPRCGRRSWGHKTACCGYFEGAERRMDKVSYMA